MVYSQHLKQVQDISRVKQCDHLINCSAGKLKRATVVYAEEAKESKGRTGSNCWVTHDQDEITNKVVKFKLEVYSKIKEEVKKII